MKNSNEKSRQYSRADGKYKQTDGNPKNKKAILEIKSIGTERKRTQCL